MTLVVLVGTAVLCSVSPVGTTETRDAVRVVINEIEINPPGFDTDNEWIELLNLTDETVDLAGWHVSYSYRGPGVLTIAEEPTLLPPGDRYVFVYPGLRLRNAETHAFRLFDSVGVLVEETTALRDTANDEKTWQRIPDGGGALLPELWVFRPATRGAPNE